MYLTWERKLILVFKLCEDSLDYTGQYENSAKDLCPIWEIFRNLVMLEFVLACGHLKDLE